MGIITRMRKQDAVYWPVGGVDAFGQTTVGTPVQIKCRWEDSIVAYTKPDGSPSMSRAVIYVDRDVTLHGYLWKGVLASAPADPRTALTAYRIERSDILPKLRRVTQVLRTVYV